MREKTIHLTGHRPKALGGYDERSEENAWLINTAARVLNSLKLLGYSRLISGMALGWDQWALETAIYHGFYTIAAIPCANQENLWPEESKKAYHHWLEQCDEKVFVSTQPYHVKLMQERNIWMVDNATVTLAAYNGGTGGTRNCLVYAQKQNNLIYIVNSKERSVKVSLGGQVWEFPI